MAAPGAFFRSIIGADAQATHLVGTGVTTYAMAALNTGWCARFMATDARDIKSVRVNFSAVTAAGVITLRIETIDATTGKPSGTLYDAAATKAFTPAAGWNLVTFDVLPTTGPTAGTEYAIVMLTTTAGTTHTLRSSSPPGGNSVVGSGAWPCQVLTAADGTTRTNFAELGTSVAICTIIFEDDVEEPLEFCQFATATTFEIYGTRASGAKIVVPAGVTLNLLGVDITYIVKVGTPAGDLRCRIFTSADATVSGSTVTIDKDSLITGVSGRRIRFPFPGVLSLGAGTYRIVIDSQSSANASNCWRVSKAVANSSGLVPSSFIETNTTDVTAGPITWTDTATEQSMCALRVDSISGSGGGGLLLNSGMTGGLRG